jgi:hypothetical protein
MMIGNKRVLQILTFILVSAMAVVSCKPNEPENPYNNIVTPVNNDNPSVNNLPEGSFAWLHAKVFRPTCANSGCHDGTFEPEFRSIASSYNTLVNQPVITNDANSTFIHRVVPGNAASSLLHERLTNFIPNTSGKMPLVFDVAWSEDSTLYIQKITDWINQGAKDMYGNPAPSAEANTAPIVYALAIFPQGNTTTPYSRETDSPNGIGAILVPNGMVDVWIAAYDDNAGVNEFASIDLKVSPGATLFSSVAQSPFILSAPIEGLDFSSSPTTFYYKATINLSALATGSSYYLRTYLNDGVQTTSSEVPNDSSSPFWYLYFSIKVQ